MEAVVVAFELSASGAIHSMYHSRGNDRQRLQASGGGGSSEGETMSDERGVWVGRKASWGTGRGVRGACSRGLSLHAALFSGLYIVSLLLADPSAPRR